MEIRSFATGSHLREFLRFSPTAPVIWSAFLIILSSELYSLSHLSAVLGPTLSTPGILSALSPMMVK